MTKNLFIALNIDQVMLNKENALFSDFLLIKNTIQDIQVFYNFIMQ